jgi:3-dehydroquinate dehydratase/shikimate dehydrogenase
MREAMKQLRRASKLTGLVEIRVDGIRDLNLEQLLRHPRSDVIITNRRTDEGGKFNGTAKEQFRILSKAVKHGAEYIDAEVSWGESFIAKLKSQHPKTPLIVSYHNFKETPVDLLSIYRKIRETRVDIVKIATMSNDISDNKQMFNLLQTAHKDRQKTIAICMGERGQVSRILTGRYDGYLTFASMRTDQPTAPGQLTFEELKSLFRTDTINKRTKVFGLIGNPVAYSKGIDFHNRIFKRRSVNAAYVNFLVDDLPCFMKTFGREFSGYSVTMPYKEQIVPILDNIDGEASKLGIVNTVINRKGKLVGLNTDLPALIAILKRRTPLRKKRVLVLGTGATSKTMAYAGMTSSADVTIVGRSITKAKALANELNCQHDGLENIMNIPSDILMNGTSVGMVSKESLVPKKYFRKGMVVLDAVYSSTFTPLLLDAKAAGCNVVSGVELFERQAKLQSKMFLELMQ